METQTQDKHRVSCGGHYCAAQLGQRSFTLWRAEKPYSSEEVGMEAEMAGAEAGMVGLCMGKSGRHAECVLLWREVREVCEEEQEEG